MLFLVNKRNSINAKINEWSAKGLITNEQRCNIIDYENSAPSRVRFQALTLLSVLGGLFIALGIILVISFNWEDIPRFCKVTGLIIAIIGVAELSIFFGGRNIILSKTFEIIWFFLPLAGIGLYGQIYQLSGDYFKPTIVWLLLTLPLIYFTPTKHLAFLHTIGLIIAAFIGTFESGSLISLYGYRYNSQLASILVFVKSHALACCLIFILWANILYQGRKFFDIQIRKFIIIALMLYLWSVGLLFSISFGYNSEWSLYSLAAALPIFYTALNFLYCGCPDKICITNYFLLNAVLYAFTFL